MTASRSKSNSSAELKTGNSRHQVKLERKLIPLLSKKTTAIKQAQRIRSEFLLEKSVFI